jgi:hypothetical protein
MTDINTLIDAAQARKTVDDTLTHLLAIAVKKDNATVADELRWTIQARMKRTEVADKGFMEAFDMHFAPEPATT